ncbi:uncharacterized protein LOC109541561 isoform X2 [Dendroctonus ponderosae]|uniref:uncharacterized protein LOC109541561 isoform X2 n=1 Tax=Dendroctonus ponderosae TaxID=77166 RepID=UPI002035B75C|nr:uncharacterized protein LOC109541561 isoform X2 [Dendroctonus ponderosae]
MSCRGRCGDPEEMSPSRDLNLPGPSHRTVHVSIEGSPTRPEPVGGSYAEYSGYGNTRIPPSARASTPGPYGYSNQYDAFGSQMDYNLNSMSKDINLLELLGQSNGRLTSRIRGADQNISQTPSTIHPPPAEASYMNAKPLLETEQAAQNEASANAKRNEHERRESLMEWFDRSVEKELKNQKTASFNAGPQFPPPLIAVDEPQLNLSKGTLQRMSGATASQVEMLFDLRKEPDTELTDAVDKLAKAEQMCEFAGAIQAAEAAAVAAPPDLVEEAALASARGYQTDVKATRVQGELEGARPIEILGYVGVTKPKYPTKRT